LLKQKELPADGKLPGNLIRESVDMITIFLNRGLSFKPLNYKVPVVYGNNYVVFVLNQLLTSAALIPGPMVELTVIFLIYCPFAATGRALIRASITAL